MKALALMVQKLWPRLKFLKSRSKVKFKVTWSKILYKMEMTCLCEYTCNMKGLALMVQNIRPRLKFLKGSSKVKVKGHKVINFVSNEKVLPEGISMCNIKALAFMVQKVFKK